MAPPRFTRTSQPIEAASECDHAVQTVGVAPERSTVQCCVWPAAVIVTAALLVPLKVIDVFTVAAGKAPNFVTVVAALYEAVGL